MVAASMLQPPRMVSRPLRRPEESPLSYIIRIAEANGYQDHRWLFQLAGIGRQGRLAHVDRRDRIAAVLGEEPEAFLPLRTVEEEGGGETEVGIGGDWLPAGYLDHEGPRLCPQCLRENRFRHALWDLKAFTCCPGHGVRLVEVCSECKAPVKVNSDGLVACSCGADFRDAGGEPASAAEVALHQWIAYLAGFHRLPTATVSAALAPQLRQLSLRDLITLVTVLGWGRSVNDPLEVLSRAGARDWTNVVREGAELLAQWPSKFTAMVRNGVSSQTYQFYEYRKANPHLYAALSGRFREERFDFVREALAQVENEVWQSFKAVAGRHLAAPAAARAEALVGARSLATQLGLQEAAVVQLAHAGVLPTVTGQVSYSRRDWLFEANTAEKLFRDMEQASEPAPDDGFTTALPLFKARKINGMCASLPWLLEGARSGETPLVTRIDPSRGLNGCFFSHEHLVKAVAGERTAANSRVSYGTMADLLGLRESVWDWLIEKGHLHALLGCVPGPHLSTAQCWKLFDAIIVPGHVIFGRQTGVRHGKSGLEQIRAVPFASSANGCDMILYWRRDVQARLSAHLANR